MKIASKEGFTLIEMVVVIALFAVLSVVLTSLFIGQNRIYKSQTAELNVTRDARSSLDEVDDFVRLANKTLGSYSTYTAGPQTLILRISSIDAQQKIIPTSYDSVVFYLNGNNLFRQTFPNAASVRPAQTKRVASNVQSLTFGYNSSNFNLVSEVTTNITLQESAGIQNRSISLSTNTKLRNRSSPTDTSATLPNNLIAHWRMDEASSTRVDATGRGNDLTDNNTVTQSTGKVDDAAHFTSANSEYLSLADNADLSVADIDFTIAGWVYFDSLSPVYRAIMSKDGSVSIGQYEIRKEAADKRFTWLIRQSNGSDCVRLRADSFGDMVVDTWYFVLVEHDSVNNIAAIIINNEVRDTVATIGTPWDGTGPLHLGAASYLGVYGNPGYFSGRIDEFGFWKRLLTDAEKTDLFGSGEGKYY